MKNFCLGIVLILSVVFNSAAQMIDVLTQHYDNERLGANLNETTLNTTNVNTAGFGKLYAYPADGHIYAQPLIAKDISIPGISGTRNIIFIATQHNTVYAYDADSLTKPYWTASMGPSCPSPDPALGYRYGPYHDIKVEIGITSTPVIDLTSKTIYIVAFTKENGVYKHRLHALDIATGQPKNGSPVLIQASVPGTGDGSTGGVVTFQSLKQLQRSSLLLHNGVVYFAFAGYADTDPYHGWIFGYNAADLTQKYVFNTSPNGEEAGIWMSGQGPSVDADGNIYYVTGNGDYNAHTGGTEYGDSFIKLKPTGSTLEVVDYFTPYNQAYLASVDADLGIDGPILIPGTNYVVAGSKEGKIYVLDRNNLGGYNTTGCNCDDQIVQSFTAFEGHLHGSYVYWEGPDGKYIYGWSEDDYLKAFSLLNTGLFDPTPSSMGSTLSPGGMPGGMLSVSANGSTAGTGIVWASIPLSANANPATVTGILRAYDASDLTKELWNSQENSARDAFGNFAKFNTPVVVNGKVYHATFSNQLVVYGLNPPALILREPENPPGAVPTLDYKFYQGANYGGDIPLLSGLTPVSTGTVATFSTSPATVSTNYMMSFTGFINVPTDGIYTFYTSSDDGSQLFIGTTLIVNNDGPHGVQERQGTIGLKAGKHKITVNYYQGTGGQGLTVSYKGPSITKTTIPASVLFRVPPPTATATATPSNSVCAGTTLTLNAATTPGQTYQWLKNGVKIYTPQAAKASYIVTASGSYQVVVTNDGGVDTSSALTVTIHPNPSASTITGSATVTTGSSATYSVPAKTGSTFTWQITGGTPANSAGTSVDVTWGPAGNGIVKVTETDANTCTKVSQIPVTISVSTGIADASLPNAETYLLQNYPNPAAGTAVIEFGAKPGSYVMLQLYTRDGIKLHTLFEGYSGGHDRIILNTSDLMNGMYIYTLQSDQAVLNRSMIILK